MLLIVTLIHLVLDGTTVYTVHHLESVPGFLNDTVHRLFLGSMVLVIYLFYRYIAILVAEETGKSRRLDLPACIFLVVAELGNFLLPISYTVTPSGNYSSGPYMMVPYGAVVFYLLLCAELLTVNWRQIDKKKKFAIGVARLAGESMRDDSVYGTGENRIEIDGGIGAINIDFAEVIQ